LAARGPTRDIRYVARFVREGPFPDIYAMHDAY
jgi:hypothetical protein